MVSRMKAAGVTTVVLLGDFSMNGSLMRQATSQGWFPEWFFTGALYTDIGILVRSMPKEQTLHAFGISSLWPFTDVDAPALAASNEKVNLFNWYWGAGAGTQTGQAYTPLSWVLWGIHAAGPKLTPRTFAQGLFAIPPSGGATDGRTDIAMTAFGKGPNLPYDSYLRNGLDFAPYWWDQDTTGPSDGQGSVGRAWAGTQGEAKRYTAGHWPTKKIGWFDKSTAVYQYTEPPTALPTYAGPCRGCPATGGPGAPGSPSKEGFVVKANGEGEAGL